jgi:hypothetical protein
MRVHALAWLLVSNAAGAVPAAAQSVSAPERDALVRLHVARGGRAGDVEALLRHADAAGEKGLPVAALTNKIREGLAKGADPRRIDAVIVQMTAYLEGADRIVRDVDPAAPARDAAVTLLAEAMGGGVTAEEIRAIQQQTAAAGGTTLNAETLASAAKGLLFIKEAKLPSADGTAVVVEAGRRGFRAHEIVDVGREVKRREADYRAGRATLRALRDAIARGDRPEQLLRDTRDAAPAERPAAGRPESTTRPEPTSRPEATRPERPVQPERPVRPEQPSRPAGRNP